jgi:hypothetical protein
MKEPVTTYVPNVGVDSDSQTVPENEVLRMSPVLATVVVEPDTGLLPSAHGGGVVPAACTPLLVPRATGVPFSRPLVEVKFCEVETITPEVRSL